MSRKIKVLIVDDSALVRSIFSRTLAQDPDIEVVGTAADGAFALRKVEQLDPDVITLDLEMKQMGGLEFLGELRKTRPRPVIMVSAHTSKGAATTMRALELGAADFITKPSGGVGGNVSEILDLLVQKIKALGTKRATQRPAVPAVPETRVPLRFQPAQPLVNQKVLAIGTSTGGPEALKVVLSRLPADTPATVVVQHMPETFTRAFAERLNGLCAMDVKEAEEGDILRPGLALIAAGHSHLRLERTLRGYVARLGQDPPVMRHRPSVDALFDSVAQVIGRNAVGVIMTGMGADGARGMFRMKEAGAVTIAQDEASCIVYGMPKEAVALRGVDFIVPLEKIPETILQCLEGRMGPGSARSARPAATASGS